MSTTFHNADPPEFEVPVQGCHRQLRWPGMIVAAASPSPGPSSPPRSWFELSPMFGGMALVGAGHVETEATSDIDAGAVRETLWATATAGDRLVDVISTAKVADRSDLGVVYAIVDPVTRRVELVVRGIGVSALVIQHPRGESAPIEIQGSTATTALASTAPEGSTLMLLAHPDWRHPVAETVQQILDVELPAGDEQAASLRLCSLVCSRTRWNDAAAVVIHFGRPEGMGTQSIATKGPPPVSRLLLAGDHDQAPGQGAAHPAAPLRCRRARARVPGYRESLAVPSCFP